MRILCRLLAPLILVSYLPACAPDPPSTASPREAIGDVASVATRRPGGRGTVTLAPLAVTSLRLCQRHVHRLLSLAVGGSRERGWVEWFMRRQSRRQGMLRTSSIRVDSVVLLAPLGDALAARQQEAV
jgi:hypothetical protein